MSRQRATPRPIPQEEPSLPPLGQLVADGDGERLQCHACGRFYRGLHQHVLQSHGLTVDAYRERYQLNRTQSLASPKLRDAMREKQAPRLAAMRPEITPVMEASREQIAAWSSQSRRLQMRVKHSEDIRQNSAERPQPRKPEAPALPMEERIRRANAARAECLRDPAKKDGWKAAITAGRRHLTPEQVEEIRSLQGRASKQSLMERFGIGRATVTRIWDGTY